jgi:endonuclease-3
MNKTKRQQFFARLQAENPEPSTELNYTSNFELLISVMLSAQATDKSVNKATALLYPIANTPQAILNLGEDGLKKYIKTIGLYNSKAQNVIKTCKLLLDEHDGQVPNERKALEALPGVGRKTANVILNTAFAQPTMAVDTHIFRLSNRTGLAKGKTVRQVEDQLMKNIPEEYLQHAHHWLILHGRYVCVARKPKCASCILEDLCEYKEKAID